MSRRFSSLEAAATSLFAKMETFQAKVMPDVVEALKEHDDERLMYLVRAHVLLFFSAEIAFLLPMCSLSSATCS